MIAVDTHVLLWWLNGSSQLSAVAQKAIKKELSQESGVILVSSISAWEIALLVEKGRLVLSINVDDWLKIAEEIDGVRFVAVDNDVAIQATRLPGDFHADPADRMIVAMARHLGVPLVTADARIRGYKYLKTIW